MRGLEGEGERERRREGKGGELGGRKKKGELRGEDTSNSSKRCIFFLSSSERAAIVCLRRNTAI